MSEMILLTADPGAGFRAHADELRAAVERVLTSGYYIFGPEVEAFEAGLSAEQRVQLGGLLTVYAGAVRVRDVAVFVGFEVESLVEGVGVVSGLDCWGV